MFLNAINLIIFAMITHSAGQLFVRSQSLMTFVMRRMKGWPANGTGSCDSYYEHEMHTTMSFFEPKINTKTNFKHKYTIDEGNLLILISRKILDYNSDRIVENSTFTSTRKSC